MAKVSKRIREMNRQVGSVLPFYALAEAVGHLKRLSTTKFDESLEIAVHLGLDTRHADQQLRGFASCPHGTGKVLRVCVFAVNEKAEEARKAGADIVGGEDLLEKIQGGMLDFDRCIATPDMMGLVGRLGRILGPRNLMPNPKLGTVTMNIAQVVSDMKAGQVQFRAEKAGIVYAGLGKLSFSEEALVENVRAFLSVLSRMRPASSKGTYFRSIFVSSTMGRSFRLDLSDALSS